MEEPLKKIEKHTLIIAWASLVVASITGIVFDCQFKEMQTQTRILNTQAAQAAADSIEAGKHVERQLDLTAKQVEAAQDSVEAIRRQMRQDQRAWIKISAEDFTFTEGRKFIAPTVVVNTGKTAAKHVLFDAVIKKVKLDETPTFNYPEKRNKGKVGVMYDTDPPTELLTSWLKDMPGDKLEPQSISHQDMEDFRRGDAYMMLYARATYFDIFGVQHWVHHCSFGPPLQREKLRTQKCSDYNDTDNN